MDLSAPFTGVIYMPDKAFAKKLSPVMLADGRTVANVQWHTWTVRSSFEILESPSGLLLAKGEATGWLGRKYVAIDARGRTLVQIELGTWRPINGSTITLSSGRTLSVKGNWTGRKFEFRAGDQVVGRISPTTSGLSIHPDSYAFEVLSPLMSLVEAVSLAQCLRAVVKADRNNSSHGSAAVIG